MAPSLSSVPYGRSRIPPVDPVVIVRGDLHEVAGERNGVTGERANGAITLAALMSKKTKKRKARLRRSKANHGKRPNTGRG